MIVTDESRSKDLPPFYSRTIEDPWANWKPLWTGKKVTPQDTQEQHSPTEQVTVRLTSERQVHKSKRRIVDGRLWEAMTPAQQDAALAVAASFETMGRGMGFVTSNWQRIPGCKGSTHASEAHTRLINFYIEWAQKCAPKKISHSMVIDVLCFGFSCRMIDRDRRLKTGSTRENLMQGLSLYCDLRGWEA